MSDELSALPKNLKNKTPKYCLPISLSFYLLITEEEADSRAKTRGRLILAEIF